MGSQNEDVVTVIFLVAAIIVLVAGLVSMVVVAMLLGRKNRLFSNHMAHLRSAHDTALREANERTNRWKVRAERSELLLSEPPEYTVGVDEPEPGATTAMHYGRLVGWIDLRVDEEVSEVTRFREPDWLRQNLREHFDRQVVAWLAEHFRRQPGPVTITADTPEELPHDRDRHPHTD